MTRTELYARVWRTPLRKLGPELGLSDVGLLKACRRHAIPTPGLGYWAKVQAGHTPPKTPLPRPEHDPEVLRADVDGKRHVSPRQDVGARQPKASPPPLLAPAALPVSLDGCHRVVEKTARYFERVRQALAEEAKHREHAARTRSINWAGVAVRFDQRPTRTTYGRFTCAQPGCLRIAATLDSVDWILRFHEALLQTLEPAGCGISASDQRDGLQITHGRETVNVSFTEEMEPAKARAGASSQDFVSRGTFKLTLHRWSGGTRAWSGSPRELEQQLAKIATALMAAPAEQGTRRVAFEAKKRAEQERQAAEAALREQRSREAQEQLARRAARIAQYTRAEEVVRLVDQHARMLGLLAEVERRLPADAAKRAAVQAWLQVARLGLRDPVDALIAQVASEGTKDTPPLWWPRPPAA